MRLLGEKIPVSEAESEVKVNSGGQIPDIEKLVTGDEPKTASSEPVKPQPAVETLTQAEVKEKPVEPASVQEQKVVPIVPTVAVPITQGAQVTETINKNE